MHTYPDLQMYIDGNWIKADHRTTEPVINPATGETLGHLPHASAADLDRALESAQKGFALWRAIPAAERGKVLRRAAEWLLARHEEIARIATMEQGKPLAESRIEVLMAADCLQWYAEEGRRAYGRVLPRASGQRALVIQEPVGPVAAFAPWNFPLGNPARKLGAPLAAGCSVILKPPEEAPASAMLVARALAESGLPAGVMNLVYGVPDSVSRHLLGSRIIRKLSFTGSVAVGKHLMKLAANNAQRTTMELGGHAPVLIFDDADLDLALDLTVAGKYRNAGQVCISPTRFYVHEAVYDTFVQRFAERAAALRVGNGLDEGVQMGPLANARRPAAVAELIEDARRHGARVLTGGHPIEGGAGWFWQPSVLADVPITTRIMNEEPFGPVALMTRFSDLDSVIDESNRLPYGLAAYAFTRSSATAMRVGEALEAGMLGINTLAIAAPDAPFGGVKDSGHGAENAIEGLQACLVTKYISHA